MLTKLFDQLTENDTMDKVFSSLLWRPQGTGAFSETEALADLRQSPPNSSSRPQSRETVQHSNLDSSLAAATGWRRHIYQTFRSGGLRIRQKNARIGEMTAKTTGVHGKLSQVIPKMKGNLKMLEVSHLWVGMSQMTTSCIQKCYHTFIPCWYRLEKKKKRHNRLHMHPQIINHLFYISYGYGHNVIFNLKNVIHTKIQFVKKKYLK